MVKLNTKHLLIVHPEFARAAEFADMFTSAVSMYSAHPSDNINSFVKELNSLESSDNCSLLVYESAFANELLTAAALSVNGPVVYVGNNPQPHYKSLHIKCLPESAGFEDICGSLVRPSYSLAVNGAAGFAAKAQANRMVIDYSKQRVFYIEDNHDISRSIIRALVRIGFKADNITYAEDGEAANDILASKLKFDFLLTDNDAPEADFGINLIETRHNDFKAIVLCTGNDDKSLIKRAEKAGAVFLPKPFGMNDLRDGISESYAQNGYIPPDKAAGR